MAEVREEDLQVGGRDRGKGKQVGDLQELRIIAQNSSPVLFLCRGVGMKSKAALGRGWQEKRQEGVILEPVLPEDKWLMCLPWM